MNEAEQFLKNFVLYLKHEKDALEKDRNRYLEYVEKTMEDRLKESGLSLDDSATFYSQGNLPKNPIRNGMILASLYYRIIGKDIWQKE
jgi:hypothetical protein